jgi:hypothetical protein
VVARKKIQEDGSAGVYAMGRQSFGFGGVVSQPDFGGMIVGSVIVGNVNPVFAA